MLSGPEVGDGVEDEVREILRTKSGLGDAALTMPASEDLWQLGMTSVASVAMMVALEETFSVKFPAEKLRHATFGSVDNIVACLHDLREVAPHERH